MIIYILGEDIGRVLMRQIISSGFKSFFILRSIFHSQKSIWLIFQILLLLKYNFEWKITQETWLNSKLFVSPIRVVYHEKNKLNPWIVIPSWTDRDLLFIGKRHMIGKGKIASLWWHLKPHVKIFRFNFVLYLKYFPDDCQTERLNGFKFCLFAIFWQSPKLCTN